MIVSKLFRGSIGLCFFQQAAVHGSQCKPELATQLIFMCMDENITMPSTNSPYTYGLFVLGIVLLAIQLHHKTLILKSNQFLSCQQNFSFLCLH